jgi:hypothetical protein
MAARMSIGRAMKPESSRADRNKPTFTGFGLAGKVTQCAPRPGRSGDTPALLANDDQRSEC